MKHTALDAVGLGFETHLLVEACRGVDLQPGDAGRPSTEMRAPGGVSRGGLAMKNPREVADDQDRRSGLP